MCIIRTIIAAMHFNENAGRKQALNKEGEEEYYIQYPKAKSGGWVEERWGTMESHHKIP